MTLPNSGSISTDQILAELRIQNPGRSYPLNTLAADVLALAGKSGPPVTIPNDFYGKSVVPSMTVTPQNDYSSAQTQFGPGSVTCFPGVAVQGGTGTKSYAWAVLSNPANCTLTLPNGPTATIRYSYFRNSSGNAEVVLRCTVTDAAGVQRTADVIGVLEWNGTL